MNKRTGIIIRSYVPQRDTVCVLEKEVGKTVYAYYDAAALRVGSLIHYSLTKKRTSVCMAGLDLIELPLTLAKQHLLFFHQVLELCYYFIPLGCIATDVFELVQQLYYIAQERLTILFKKFFLIKLCALMGIYPEEQEFKPYVHYALGVPLTDIDNLQIQTGTDQAFDYWLERCLVVHPYSEQFKTITLLYRNRSL